MAREGRQSKTKTSGEGRLFRYLSSGVLSNPASPARYPINRAGISGACGRHGHRNGGLTGLACLVVGFIGHLKCPCAFGSVLLYMLLPLCLLSLSLLLSRLECAWWNYQVPVETWKVIAGVCSITCWSAITISRYGCEAAAVVKICFASSLKSLFSRLPDSILVSFVFDDR